MENENENLIENQDTEKSGLVEEVLEWLESFVFAIFCVILVFTFLVRVVQVVGPSMNDTLQDGDRLVLTHFNYTPEKGDIVVVNAAGLENGKTIIKRVIATEGDTISIDFTSGEVTLNGEVLDEPYIKELTVTREGRDIENITLGEDEVFVMGDNRNQSTDSRDERVGIVKTSDILGKAVFRLFPFSGFGSLS